MPTSYTSGDITLGSGTWRGTNVIRGTTKHSGSYACQIRSSTAASMTTPTLSGGVGTISFWVQSSTTSGGLQVNISTDNGASYSPATGSPFTGLGTTYQQIQITVNNASVNKVRFYRTAATIYLDDVDITSYSAGASVTIANTGTPAAGNIAAGTSDAVLFGFSLTPDASIDFSALSLDTAGTATSADLSNFEVVYDADNSGTYNAGDSVVSSAAQALGDPISFTITGQTGFSAARRYLVIADVAASPTAGRTITCNVAAAGDVTTTGTESGTASGNAQTIITLPTVTSPTATAIGQTGATLGANVTSLGGTTISERGTVWGTSANPTGNAEPEGGTTTGTFSESRTGLTQGTKVYYRGYAVNTVGTAYSADGSFHTEPAQATDVSFSSVGTYVMTVNWTKPASADGVIVVMRAGNSTVDDPVDGTVHTANAAYGTAGAALGSSYVVYAGSGSSVDVTGLSASTTYYVEIFAYKGTVADSGVDQGINYRQTSPLAGNEATLSAGAPAAITTQPDEDYVGCSGSSVNLTVTASGSATIEYGWRKRNAGWGSSWSFTTGGDGGVFLGNNQSSIDTSTKAWGMWANNNFTTEAKRDFAALGVSNVFYVEMDNGGLNGTSVVGFSLQNSSGTSGLEFYFQGGDSNYTINRNGGEQDSGIGWSNAGLLITITNLTSTTYSMAVTVKGGSTYNFTGTYANSVSSISRFRAFYYENTGSDDVFFNNLKIGRFVNCPLYEDTAAAYSSWSGDLGTGPLANGGDVSGATSDTLTIANLEAGDAGYYDVVVYNGFGGETSSSVRGELTVTAAPTITLGALPTTYGVASTTLTYSATTGTPDQYMIDWDATAEAAGFADVAYTALPASPISVAIPFGVASATYSGTLKVKNTTTGCESTGYSLSLTTDMPQARNTSGGTPQAPATIYLGDTGLTFGLDSWGTVGGNWGAAWLWLRYDNSDLTGGTASDWTGFVNTDNKTRTSGVFNQAGTWYWGLQMDYGAPHGMNFWYKSANADWTDMAWDGTNATLSVTVSALSDPSCATATAARTSQINLSWTLWNSKNVMVVSSTDDSFTAPTPGTPYAVNDTIGDDTVIYTGSGGTHNDTGRDAGTIYYYKFYSINNDYYSAGASANATTWGAATVSTTSATPGTPADPTQANATGNVTADGGSTVSERGIVWQSTAGDPDTSDTKVAHASGGTGEFTVTLTGLTPGQTVYYRAYAINDAGTAYGTTLNFAADCFTNGPGILAASDVISTNFTANWEAVAGASGYEIDVMTSVGSAGGLFISEVTDPSDVYQGRYVELYNASGADIDFSTATWYLCGQVNGAWNWDLQLSGVITNGATFVVAYNAANFATAYGMAPHQAYGSLNGNGDDGYYLYEGGNHTAGTLVDAYGVIGQDGSTTDWEYTDSHAVRSSSISTGNTTWTSSEWTISSAAIADMTPLAHTASGGAATYVASYEDKSVGNVTTLVVTGLTTSTEYFYRVRATNDFCTSANSGVTNATTAGATPTVVLGNNGTQVAGGNVAQGTLNLVLHKFQLAVTDAAATLTGVSFTSAGDYVAGDLDNFKVWYSADNAFDSGTDTLLGTIDATLGAGSHSLASLSQGIAEDATGYVFITADFDAAATIGNEINVEAVTTGGLTFTAANASGSTTAGGAYAIISSAPSYTLRTTGFEGTEDDNWSWTPSSTSVELGPRDDAITGKTGDYSLMLTGSQAGNVDPYILFDNVTIPDNATDIALSVGYAASGADVGDDLYVAVSYDNGATWESAIKLVDGDNNFSLDFGDTDVIDRTPQMANPYVLTIPDDTAQVRVKITYDEAASDNRYDEFYIDEVKLVASLDLPTVSFAAARTVTNEDYTTQFSIPVTISTASDATVRVAIAGTALPGGQDFTAASTTLVFTAAGATTQNLLITLNDDSLSEGVETVRFTLTLPEGAKIVGPDVHVLFIRDDDAFTIATANLISGTLTVGDGTTPYDDPGQRLLKALLPDVVAIQEWVVTNGMTNATFVSSIFGSEYDYYVEPEGDTYAQPNGIISRWPITASGQWADNYVGARDYVWATIDLPGAVDLNVVNVHFKMGDTEATARANEATELTNYIFNAGFDAGDYLVIAGDLNLEDRTETAYTKLTAIVSGTHIPEDKAGSDNTNPSATKPYDHVLPNALLELQHVGMSYNGTSFPDGFIFDSREWGDHQYPALGSDSEDVNMTHRPVLKTYTLGEIVAPPAAFTATANGTTQIDLAFATNAAQNTIVIVYDGDGTFTAPSGAAPSVNDPFAGGTVIYVGTGSSYSHTGLDSCKAYYYSAWSVSATPVWSSSLTDDATTATPSAPTGLFVDPTNNTSFVAHWTAVPGATGYRIDVSTEADFEGSGGSALDISGYDLLQFDASYTYTFPASTSVDPGGYVVIGRNVDQAAFETAWGVTLGSSVVYLNGANGMPVMNGAETFLLRDASDVTVDGQTATDITGAVTVQRTNATADATLTSSWTETAAPANSTPGTGGVGDGTGGLVINEYSEHGTFANEFVELFYDAAGSSPAYVGGFSNLAVAVTNVTVTGLTSGVTYYYRVRAEGTSGCTSDNSTTASVITVAGTPYIALADNGTQVGEAAVTAGTDNHVLHQFQLTATNAATTLQGVSFTSAGTYDAADLDNFKVYYSTDSTLETGTDTLLGTISTSLGAGAHSLSGLSQVIALDATVYIFITADVAAGATPGNTISVSAVATGDLTFSAGNKTGSTTAGGAQTIAAAEPTTHASALVFTDVGLAQMTISWANGDGANRIVVVHPGSATSWTPTDGVAPSGVNADYSSADDQENGNRICYNGSATNFTLSGLTAGTTYYVTVFEYNGSGTYINYYTAGTPLTGSQATTCPATPGTPWASITNYLDFTAAWSAVSGATGYRIDVSTVSDFSGASGISDDFTDGNFSSSLAWSGDTAGYLIITDGTLPGGSAATDQSFLGSDGTNAYSALSTPCTESNEWRFSLGSPDYDPSSANYFGVVLMADAPFSGDIATNDFQGYYLKLGVDGATDYIELWRKTGVGNEKVGNFSAAGNFAVGALQNGLNIRVTRNASGEFTLYYSTGFTYAAEPTNNGGTLTNAVYGESSYFGIYGRFLSNGTTRRTYFDNFQTGSGGGGSYVPGYEDREVAGATSVSVTGLLENTTYYFRIRSEAGNCESDNSPTASVTTKTSTVEAPAAFTATAASVSQIDLAFATNAAQDTIVIVWNLTGTFEVPSGSAPTVGNSFAGGTVLYVGTGASYSHTGLDSCTPYYYRAWSVNGTDWSPAASADDTTDAPGAPTTIWVSATNYYDFTLEWDAVSGAAGYYVDVSPTNTFSAGGGDNERLVVASNAAASAAAITNEWSGYDIGSGSGYVLMIKPTSVITSPAFSTVGFTNLTVDYKARTYGGANATYNRVTVSISTNDGADWTVIGTGLPTSTTLTAMPTLTNTTDLGYAQTRIRWQTLAASGTIGAGVNTLVVQGWNAGEGTSAYVGGYSNLQISAGTSVSVTGLLEATTYYFRIRTEGEGGCTSASSAVGDETTRSGSPFAPSFVTASDGTYEDRVSLVWANVAEETGFVIWRHTLNLPGNAVAIGTNAADDTDFDDATATPGQIYYYWVSATNGIGSSPKSSVDTGYRRLAAPTGVAASDGTSTVHVEVTWTGSDGATSYKIYRHTGATPEVGMADLGVQGSGYLDTTAVPGQQYYYWIMAEASSSSSTSTWSAADGGYRKLGTPAGVTASYDDYNDRIEVDWTDLTGETGYGIWRNVVNDSATAAFIATVAAGETGYDDYSGDGGVEYFYFVTATNTTSSSMGDFQANGALGRMLDPDLPIVLTETPTGITSGGANGGGDVVNEGTSEVTERGVVWSASQNPTTADSKSAHPEGGPGYYTNYLSGLVAGQTYYVRAYASNTAGIVYGEQKSFATPCFSGVVTNLHANPTNGLDFTANWDVLPGATGYRLDVSTNQYFMEGSSVAEVISESFAGFTTLNGTTDRSGTLNTYMETLGWTGLAVYENAGEVKMGSSSVAGILTTPALDLSANGGQATFTFDARLYGTDTPTVYVSVSPDGVNYYQSGNTYLLTADMTTYTNLITNGTASCRVRLTATVNSSKRFYLDNWLIEQGSGEPSFLPGYSNLAVSGTSQLVSGLETNSWYYFRVRAEGAESCLSGNSATLPVQTRDLSPSAPGSVAATDGTFADRVQVTWAAVGVASNYAIYRNTNDPTFNESVCLGTVDKDTLSYDDATADPGHLNWYWVVATNEYGWDVSADDTGWRGMAAVANVAATDGTYTDRVAVTWTDLDGGETAYAVWRSETSSSNAAVCVGAAGAEDVAYADVDAIPGQQYWYWVLATNDTSAGLGAWGTADQGYRKLPVVEPLEASFNVYDDRIRISWPDSEGETGYAIWSNHVDNFATASWLETLDAGTTNYDDYDAVTGTIYYYWVRATNATSATQSDPQANGAVGRRAQTPPTVTTLAISNNVLGSAMGGGEVLDAGGSSITNRGLVWNTTGNPTIADSHVQAGAGAGLGTYSATVSPTTGGLTYYVRAYAQNAERIAYGPVVSFVGECMGELPATLAATDVASTTFQANWTSVTGAGSYRLDVSTNATFLGGYDANVAAYHNGVLGEGTGGTWLETNVLQSAGYVALRTNNAALATPAIDFNAGTGEALAFRARIFGGGGNGDFRNKITVSVSTDDGTTWTNVGTRTPVNTTLTAMEPFDLSGFAGTQVKVRLQTLQSSAGVGAGVVDVAVTNLLDPRGVFIGGYSNRTENGTSLVVTGLLPEVTYYYRVRAYASESCTSGNSDTRTVATLAYESIWDGEGGNNRNWTTAANWDGDALPQTNATVYFYSDINGTSAMVDLDGNQTVKGVRFTDGASANVNIRSNVLTVFGGGLGVGAGASGDLAILSDLTAAADQGWTNASPNDFTIAGNVAGAGVLAKYGDGRIVLTGNDSTFTGGLTIHAGALQARGTNALGSTGAGTTVADGAALELHGGGNAVDYAAEPLTIAGSGVSSGGALRFVQNNVDYKGAITLAADARIQAASNSPVASGAIAIGGYTLAVGVPADATELRLGGNLSGTRSGSGEYALIKDGSSRLLLTGNSVGLTGAVYLQEGELRLGNANALGSIGPLVFGNNVVMKSASVADYTISRPLLVQGNVSFGEAATRTGTLEFGGDV
ncbi:MAG: hypothetical protein AB7V22_04150, partial [Kiritimatiellia bacterium]